jgi:hypothetical protein
MSPEPALLEPGIPEDLPGLSPQGIVRRGPGEVSTGPQGIPKILPQNSLEFLFSSALESQLKALHEETKAS